MTRGGRDVIPIKNLTWHLTSKDRTVQRNRYRVPFSSWTLPTSPWNSAFPKLTFSKLRNEQDTITGLGIQYDNTTEDESPPKGSRRRQITIGWLLVFDSRRLFIVLGWDKGRCSWIGKKSIQGIQCFRLVHCEISKNHLIPDAFPKVFSDSNQTYCKAFKRVYWSVKHV